MKKIGTILIILGIFISSITFPFTTTNEEVKKLHMLSIFSGGSPATDFRDLQLVISEKNEIIIKYKYVLALSTFISFFGISLLSLSKKSKIL